MSGAQGMAKACIGEPISWLRLERLALDELPDAAAVRAHLDACPACAAAFAQIREDARPLPALPRLATVRVPDDAAAKEPWWRRWRRHRFGSSLALAGAMVALLLWLNTRRSPQPDDGELVVVSASRTLRVKGAGGASGAGGAPGASDVTVTLVRERDGAVSFDPPDIEPGDRWKIQLTCAPAGPAGLSSVWVDVAVVQANRAGFPLAPSLVACGNNVVVPGAFRITGGAASICVTLDATEPDRARFTTRQRRDAICTRLTPASSSTRLPPLPE